MNKQDVKDYNETFHYLMRQHVEDAKLIKELNERITYLEQELFKAQGISPKFAGLKESDFYGVD